jgi:tetratricopeptide (TPR) repeat protein
VKKPSHIFAVFLILGFLSPLYGFSDSYERGLESLDLMAYTQALQHFENAISEDPNKQDVRVSMAETYLRMKRPEDALRVLQEERFLFPDSINARVMLAYVYFLQDKKDDAIEICEDFDNLFLEDLREEADIEKKDPEALAKEKVEGDKLTLFVPMDYMVARAYGREKPLKPENEKDKEKAEDALEDMIEKNPNLGLPYFVLGAIQKTSVDFEKASQSFNMAIAAGYDPVCCYSQLIDLEFQKADYKDTPTISFQRLTTPSTATWKHSGESPTSLKHEKTSPGFTSAKTNSTRLQHSFKRRPALIPSILMPSTCSNRP